MKKRKRNQGIQFFRLLLFLGIVAFHCGLPGSQMLWGGVEAFFVLSAYFMTKKLSSKPTGNLNMLSEIRARAYRLYPFYLVFLFVVAATIFLSKHISIMQDLLVHILFLQNFSWMFSGYSSPLQLATAHTWTLAIEVWLFLLWLVAFKLLKCMKMRNMWNYILIVCAILYRTVATMGGADIYQISLMPLAHADAFAIGSLMALRAAPKEEKSVRRIRPYIFVIGGACS